MSKKKLIVVVNRTNPSLISKTPQFNYLSPLYYLKTAVKVNVQNRDLLHEHISEASSEAAVHIALFEEIQKHMK